MIEKYTARLNQMKGKEQSIKEDIIKKKEAIVSLKNKKEILTTAQLIAQFLSQTSQQKLTKKLNDIVTTAMQTVFGNEWEFRMEIETKRNDIQAIPTFYKNGKEESPKVSEGGGVLSIASLALRIALYSLLNKPTPIIILDEPFGNIGKEEGHRDKACDLLTIISHELGIQFLIVTHLNEIRDVADRVFFVSMKNDVSKVITKDKTHKE